MCTNCYNFFSQYTELTLAKDRTATLETDGVATAALEEYDTADRAAIRAAEENMVKIRWMLPLNK